jgi:TolA-binding protein
VPSDAPPSDGVTAEAARTPSEPSLASAPRPPVKARKRELAPAPAVPEPSAVPAPPEEPAVSEPAEPPAPIASADLAKYRAAHKAHFQQRDFALALRNWEAYLRQFPSGTFAIEARYNRAMCLLRLGRNDEARRALTPFSRGEIGRGYRQAEATKLLEALE